MLKNLLLLHNQPRFSKLLMYADMQQMRLLRKHSYRIHLAQLRQNAYHFLSTADISPRVKFVMHVRIQEMTVILHGRFCASISKSFLCTKLRRLWKAVSANSRHMMLAAYFLIQPLTCILFLRRITYSVPYALVSARIEALGLGQGLSMGVLNLAIVIPQVIVSLGAGPWDQLFGGGNSPALVVGAISAFASGRIAILAIPITRVGKSRIHQ